jgi:zinc/manganese transport system substrate-binding protein
MRALLVLFSLLVSMSLSAAEKLQVVTSFSILADMTRQVGKEHIQITNMVGPDADAHTYEPTPDDAKALLRARLIIKNGLGFEPWLDRLVTSTETKAPVISASRGVIPRSLDEDGETVPDPHAWHNLANTELYIANITRALIAADPANSADYERNSQAYLKQVHALLAEAKAKLGSLPPGNRKIVTSHDAFGYLGQAYGIEFMAPQGLSTEREPSAAEVAALITQIRQARVKAVFMENIKDARLLKQIADESGAQIGGTLYSDALAAAMIRKNPSGDLPRIAESAYVDKTAIICGKVVIGENVFVGPYAVIRADEVDASGDMQPITIGANSNIQDGVVIHSKSGAAVTIGEFSSIAHRSIVHGPCTVGNRVFIGFNSVLFNCVVGDGCVVRHNSVVDGRDLPEDFYVPSTTRIGPNTDLSQFPPVSVSASEFSEDVARTNVDLVRGYKALQNEF